MMRARRRTVEDPAAPVGGDAGVPALGRADLRALLACPLCRGALSDEGDTLRCAGCNQAYRADESQIDLRLRREKRIEVPLTIRPLDRVAARRRRPAPIPLNPDGLTNVDPGAYPGGLENGNGLTRELVSWLPRARPGRPGILLDMGCGDRRCEPVLRLSGHHYVGMDIGGAEPDVLGIGEALPFADQSFDVVFTLSVVPHTTQPLVVMDELHRVLKPGGTYIGTMEFLEPCHMQSRHHVTALGVQDWLDTAGFELVHLEANGSWLGMDALLQLGAFFPRLSWEASGRVARFLDAIHLLLTRKQRRLPSTRPIGEGLPERVTGGFRFVARRRA